MRKANKPVYMVFPFIDDYTDRATGFFDQAPLKTGHTAYFNVLCCLLFDNNRAKDVKDYFAETESYVALSKIISMRLLGNM